MYSNWDWQDAKNEFRQAIELNPNCVAAHHWSSLYLAMRRRFDEVMEIIGQLREPAPRQYVSPYLLALLYTGLGENEPAFDWLEKACDDQSGRLAWLNVDPKLDHLRADPRFQDLLRRVGLAPEARDSV
jgi:tetratricopeptide (TPR) repeat protein